MNSGEAKEILKAIIESSRSVEEIRCRLTEAGFDSRTARIYVYGEGGNFRAMVTVRGPRGEMIRV